MMGKRCSTIVRKSTRPPDPSWVRAAYVVLICAMVGFYGCIGFGWYFQPMIESLFK